MESSFQSRAAGMTQQKAAAVVTRFEEVEADSCGVELDLDQWYPWLAVASGSRGKVMPGNCPFGRTVPTGGDTTRV